MKARNFWWIGFSIFGLGWSQTASAQEITICGSARGITPYATDAACNPRLWFHVSGQCLSACREVTREFTGPDVTAYGNCNGIGGTCAPAFIERDVYDIFTREYYSKAAHKTFLCHEGMEVRSTSGACPCAGCSPSTGPSNNTTPGEDPLLISIGDPEYRLTSWARGVKFDLNADGELEKTAWTSADSDEAFLVLDRNFNGAIDNGLEIFGDETAQLPSPEPNGFRALAVFDDLMSGGNGDGKIDPADSIFSWLMLWTDSNHDGRSHRDELQSLEGVVSAIHLDYQRTFLRDEFGNELRYWSNIERPLGNEGALVAWNVFFHNQGPPTKHSKLRDP